MNNVNRTLYIPLYGKALVSRRGILLDDPNALPGFCREHVMTPRELIDELSGLERAIFRRVYAGGMSKKLYRLDEYRR